MGLTIPDLIVLAHSANGMDPDPKTRIPGETSDGSSSSTAEIAGDEFSEQPIVRKKSILKSPTTEITQQNEKNGDRIKRTVSWHDFEGKELHTVREFVPSEHDDDEYLYNEPGRKGGCCVIC